jgi:hypothetical protein
MRHDQQSASSVRAKIAMFSNGDGSSGGSPPSLTALLTRSLTHGDVRFEEVTSVSGGGITSKTVLPKSMAGYRSMINVSGGASHQSKSDLTMSTDSLVRATNHARLTRISSSTGSEAGSSSTPFSSSTGMYQ